MGAARIYREVNGEKIEHFLASMPGTQAHLTATANAIGAKARSTLARHRHDGHSFIHVTRGEIDRYVALNDERGQLAAMSIEYGRGPDMDGYGAAIVHPGGILHDAAQIPIARSFPRSKRKKKYYTKKGG